MQGTSEMGVIHTIRCGKYMYVSKTETFCRCFCRCCRFCRYGRCCCYRNGCRFFMVYMNIILCC